MVHTGIIPGNKCEWYNERMPPLRSLDSIHKKKVHPPVVTPVVEVKKVVPKKSKETLAQKSVKLLVWTLIATAVYLIAAPYTPSVWFYFHPPKVIAQTTTLQNISPPDAATNPSFAYYGKNILTISSIGVQSEILEGVNEETLEHGLWRRPNTSTPALGGNTVIAAHRYKYTTGSNTFYNLDKVAVGDQIFLTWQGKNYTYEVYSTKIVSSTETSIEGKTESPILTLYTCTPLWSSTNRLVVQARLLY
jgi:LPXTG-site transpeptidase (sortase) family protein